MVFIQNIAVVGLGSNLGDRMAAFRIAIGYISQELDGVRGSPVYESPALLPENAPAAWDTPYLNMAVTGECGLEPLELLARLKTIEARMGREDVGRWGPRVIDLDLLVYGDRVMRTDALTLPHAGLMARGFALVPLLDLWPEWEHPAGEKPQVEKPRKVADGV
ncbi:MAG: 2-amino-4-hydroxy-6-hydroxymethyldihydropteridine diphosphokinase [Alphaproteobacteria bacterium]|nr:2-amino-4-hydroxy-6-hydroxymethyldihydropteridine diphosphokinase [Alphaproteobacteria bacterium]